MEEIKPDIQVTTTDDGSEILIPLPPVEEEELAISERKNTSSVWAVKIPRFLLERWEMVEEAGVELGKLVIDNSVTPPKIILRLTHQEDIKPLAQSSASTSTSGPRPVPKQSSYDTSGIPDEYTVHVPDERAKNTFVFTEKKRVYGSYRDTAEGEDGEGGGENDQGEGAADDPGPRKRKRQKAFPRLIAKVDHECQMQPIQNQKYLKILEQRRLESEQSKRPVMRMDDTGISQAEQNQLASGYRNATSTFGSKMIVSAKQHTGERHARLERHELTDRIFGLFKEKPYWGIPALKSVLKQPDSWLREVLRDVAEQIKEGRYMNMWQLKKSWRDGLGRVEGGGGTPVEGEGGDDGGDEGEGGEDRKPVLDEEGEGMGEDDDEGEDDDDGDDFEEVMA
ncbi:hypothetical protein I316_06806 [Kwoniella heveanensis BCC8398]|uniref:Transcription initiation factor IIF subunit beta n=1 Tax=Kwoniella heveanensis BCC8398 TaxID=1296120 RepID=A0A1B9GKT6_9TREE|nr:hypothetical protein I316_06806 [Kwoniella heveanensis BCC8398]